MVTRREDSVTLGEVYRLVLDLKEDQGEKLDAIDKQVRLTNGRTTRLEEQMQQVNRDLREVRQRPAQAFDGESFSIKVSKKMWLLIASVVGSMPVFAPIVADWIKKAFER